MWFEKKNVTHNYTRTSLTYLKSEAALTNNQMWNEYSVCREAGKQAK